MNSLREEIEDIVRSTREFTSPKITNMILEKIEKRIDERKNLVREEYFGFHTVKTAKLDELDKMKEMLK